MAQDSSLHVSLGEELLPVLQVHRVHLEEGRSSGLPGLQHGQDLCVIPPGDVSEEAEKVQLCAGEIQDEETCMGWMSSMSSMSWL